MPLNLPTDAYYSGTRDNLAGEQRGNREFHLNRDRNRMMYSVAVGEALNADSTAQRQNQLPTMNIDRAFAEAKARAEADKRGQEGR